MSLWGLAVGEGGSPPTLQDVRNMGAALGLSPDQEIELSSSPLAAVATSRGRRCSVSRRDSLLVACDAELYNRRELEERAGRESGSNVADLISALYLRYGPSFFQMLRGVFSIAIWDERSRTLLLARDRFGVGSLYYAATDKELVFASYPRGIFASGKIEKRVDLEFVCEYVHFRNVPAPKSAFQGMARVFPGEYLVWKNGQAECHRYWSMKYEEDATGSTKKLAAELLERLQDSVRATSQDLDLSRSGCFLSGGTDSSSIAGFVTRIYGQPTNTFSIGFSESEFDELYYARIAAKHYGSRHHEFIVTPKEVNATVPVIAEGYDEPFGNPSAIPAYLCSKLAREHGMDVLLAGDGGDELFGGNERYLTDEVYSKYCRLPALLRKALIEPVVFGFPGNWGLINKVRRHIVHAKMPNPERYAGDRFISEFSMEEIFPLDVPYGVDRLTTVRRYYQSAPASSELNRLLFIDINMTLGDEDIPKVVRTSEVAGINVRFPYLDHVLADFSGRLPANLKVRGFQQRFLFKQATRDLLPRAILTKKKHGFGVPVGIWLKTDPELRSLSRDVLLDPRTYQRGYFRREFVEKLIANLDDDRAPYARYYGDLLYILLMLELWHRIHVETAVAVPAAH